MPCSELSQKDIGRRISLPDGIDSDIAELVGVLIGDGHLHIARRGTTTDYRLSIAFNPSEDAPYIQYLMQQFGKKFGIVPSIRRDSHCSELLVRSKGVVKFFERLGVNAGRKVALIRIPKQILADSTFTRACLRGIFDTDFSLSFKKKYRPIHYYPVISLSSASRELRNQILDVLEELGFQNVYGFDRIRVTRNGTQVQEHELYVSGVDGLERWMHVIGTSSQKHLTKYEIWKQFGFCPPQTSLAQRRMVLGGRLALEDMAAVKGESSGEPLKM